MKLFLDHDNSFFLLLCIQQCSLPPTSSSLNIDAKVQGIFKPVQRYSLLLEDKDLHNLTKSFFFEAPVAACNYYFINLVADNPFFPVDSSSVQMRVILCSLVSSVLIINQV